MATTTREAGNGSGRGGEIETTPSSGNIKTVLEQAVGRLRSVLPRHLTPERQIQVASTLVYRTPQLQKCTRDTIRDTGE